VTAGTAWEKRKTGKLEEAGSSIRLVIRGESGSTCYPLRKGWGAIPPKGRAFFRNIEISREDGAKTEKPEKPEK